MFDKKKKIGENLFVTGKIVFFSKLFVFNSLLDPKKLLL